MDLTIAAMSDPGADPDLQPRDVLSGWVEYLWPVLQDIGTTNVLDQGAGEEPPPSEPDDLDTPW